MSGPHSPMDSLQLPRLRSTEQPPRAMVVSSTWVTQQPEDLRKGWPQYAYAALHLSYAILIGPSTHALLSSCPAPYLSPLPPLPDSHTIPGASGPSDPRTLTSSLLGGGREALATQCRILALYTPVDLSKLQVPLDKAIIWDFSAVPPCTWAS